VIARDFGTYALRLGDDCLILSHRLSEWIRHAPEIEEDVALANIDLDLLGQARLLLSYAGECEGRGRGEDDLAFLREEHEFANLLLVEQPNGDFGCTIARQLLFSTYQHALYEQLAHSADETLNGIAQKAIKETTYHRDHAAMWTRRLGDGTDESRRRVQFGLRKMWPFVEQMLVGDELDLRAGIDHRSIRRAWDAYVDDVLGESTLERPLARARTRARPRGCHTHLAEILLEMQELHRSIPGAVW
jgi:ring-1,2-phenylacetyl-CoA epoxidase subunit PaaC